MWQSIHTEHQISPRKCGVIVNQEAILLKNYYIWMFETKPWENAKDTFYAFMYWNRKCTALGLAPQMGLV